MATPVVAGSAALLRQYFTDGFWPTGKANPADAFVPSAALLRAMLIGGAVPIGGVEANTGLPVDPPPSSRQGFGRIHLGAWEEGSMARVHEEIGLAGRQQSSVVWMNRHLMHEFIQCHPHGCPRCAGNSVNLAGSPSTTNVALLDRVPIKQGGAGAVKHCK